MLLINKKYIVLLLIIFSAAMGCKKYVEIPPPDDKLTADAVFADKASIAAAMNGLYMYAMGFQFNNIYSSGRIDLLMAVGTDDAINVDEQSMNYYTNTFPPSDDDPNVEGMWSSAYLSIGRINSFIEGVQGTTVIPDELKSNYIAQAKLMRAFYYFNLTNFFGNVPLALNSDVNANALLSRALRSSVDSAIMDDLLYARDHLTADQGEDNFTLNQNAANTMLARMYGYKKDWVNEEAAATAIVNTGRYSLADVTQVFTRGNSEAIFQFTTAGTYYDGYSINSFYTNVYILTMTPSLINSFDPEDLRLANWIQLQDGNYAYYKYSTDPGNQDYVFFRLAEVILLRAEARAQQNDLTGAIDDLNLIRERAGISDLPNTLSQQEVIDAMESERRKEYFGEGITRWFDLNRWGKLQSTMLAAKPTTWTEKAALFPIKTIDLSLNRNLTQTPGY